MKYSQVSWQLRNKKINKKNYRYGVYEYMELHMAETVLYLLTIIIFMGLWSTPWKFAEK